MRIALLECLCGPINRPYLNPKLTSPLFMRDTFSCLILPVQLYRAIQERQPNSNTGFSSKCEVAASEDEHDVKLCWLPWIRVYEYRCQCLPGSIHDSIFCFSFRIKIGAALIGHSLVKSSAREKVSDSRHGVHRIQTSTQPVHSMNKVHLSFMRPDRPRPFVS